MVGLSNIQRTFCEEYVKNGNNGTQAYLKAYKSCKKENTAKANASRLLTNANIIEYIKELQEELKKKAIMTAEERMIWLSEVIQNIQREEVFVRNSEGEDILMGTKNADLNIKIKALDTLNKMTGEYTTNIKGNLSLTYEEALKKVSENDEY